MFKPIAHAKNQTKPTNKISPNSVSPFPSGLCKFTHARLQKDFTEFEPIPGCIFEQREKGNFACYKLTVSPLDGIYEHGKWSFNIDCPNDYPMSPPKVICLTPIYHPNIDLDGHVCLSILRVDEDWSPVSTLNHVVCGIFSLFIEPNADDPLNTEAGELMKRNYYEFYRMVRKTMNGGRYYGRDFPRMK
ncbi:NEDD8 carrier protein [Entamoeba marina]